MSISLLQGLDLSDKNGNVWHFPVSGGKVDFENRHVKFLPPFVNTVHDEEMVLVPCHPPNEES